MNVNDLNYKHFQSLPPIKPKVVQDLMALIILQYM
jgi:hypothetical protein